MAQYEWSVEKNEKLIKERNISFPLIVDAINSGRLIEIIDHPNKKKYPKQKIYIVKINNYIHAVPAVIDGDTIYLKTIFPCRKYKRRYIKSL